MSDRQRQFRLLPKARRDLDGIFRYTLEKWSLQQANDYYRRLTSCFPELACGARQGRNIDHIITGYFILPFESHFIVYKADARTVTIIRILHQRMNITAHLR
ncbi:type II toxin-antitoxin system RelE/ParE family toxin [Rhizobium tumorigenes]|uniref:type II toxin-antitoxin system RelE/ParE family toxin n=1 Tax=Rhizobium tumorigenes TaxID=2041385 RepID=UPI00241F332B|nr:type II toxin-antitoxin system RelE/ParE family toxin [Rhizobium tumorigenes]WFS00482.1 type II toxin-antitoxin system RelE/ParE family toxin [Rhizobium tumorigenes]